jgi:hypothetical protein
MAACRYRLMLVALAVATATSCSVNAAVSADELITLTPRPGVTQPVLLWQPSLPDPQVVLLVFPSGGGNVGFRETAAIKSKLAPRICFHAIAISSHARNSQSPL